MRRELRECKRREALDTTIAPSERSLSPFSNFGQRRSTSPYPDTQATPIALDRTTVDDHVQQAELTQLRVAQKMVESSSKMECAFCLCHCRTDKFYQHLIDKHSHQMHNP